MLLLRIDTLLMLLTPQACMHSEAPVGVGDGKVYPFPPASTTGEQTCEARMSIVKTDM